MILLALDTATPLVSAAVWRDGEVVAAAREPAERRHGERLAPAIEAVCAGAGIAVADLDAVAVDVGPGLFTGLRAGLATAKGLAAARRLPVVAVTSLEALAWAWRDEPRLLLAAVDARRGEVFAEVTQPEPGGARRPVSEPAALAPDALAALVGPLAGGAGMVAVGDGARRYADSLVAAGVAIGPAGSDHPDAAVWAPLAAAAAAAGRTTDAVGLAAMYLRGADVRIGWSERAPAVRT